MSSSIVYRIEPELACEFADDQVWVAGDELAGRSPQRPVHLEFDRGAQGAFAGCAPVWAATEELCQAWEAAGVSGFLTRPLVESSSGSSVAMPSYREVIITGGPADDVHYVAGEAEVRVSRKAAEIYARFDPGEGALYVGTEDDMYGDSLSPETIHAALPF